MEHRTTWRRTTALCAAIGLTLAACGGDDGDETASAEGELDPIAFVQPVPPSAVYYASIVAEELGFFEDEGLDAELLTSGDLTEAALIDQGQAQLAWTGFAEAMEGIDAGVDYEVVFDANHKAVEGIVTIAGSGVESMEDLEGATVGLASDSDLAFLNVALGFADLQPDDVTTVVAGTSGPTLANAFESGDIQAFAGAASDFAAMQGAGLDIEFITPQELEQNPGGSAIVMRSTIEEDADLIERFLRAWAKGMHIGVVMPDVVEAVARQVAPEDWENAEVGRASMESSIDRNTPSNDIYGEVRPDVWEEAVRQLVEAGELDGNVPTDEFLNDQFVEPANDFDRAEVEAQAEAWMEENAG
jgi:NitT/TauT family transport system substrate-binding protein